MHNITSLAQARDYGDRLSKLLKKYRELANFRLTQGDLATRVGVSARSIRDWETGINLPTARNLKKIIEVYHQLGLFTSGKEREEAEELWILRQGKDLSNTFPLFDVAWLDNDSDTSHKKPDEKPEQQPPVQTTASAPEKNITSIPTSLITGNIPEQLSSFIGRERELGEIRQLLLRTRLLTITGTGGAGKTRLAQEVAHSLQNISPTNTQTKANYPEGVWWVDLTPLTDPQQVLQAVISVLMPDGRQEGDLYELLANYLQSKKVLVVLDNCEHLIEAVGSLVRKLLKDCPYLHILATSRESLNLPGEQGWPLEGLSVPRIQIQKPKPEELESSAAVRLFVVRAKTVQTSFELNTENSGAVLEICRQLDGLPLAIELAAARVKGLDVEQISQRLQKNFKLLSGGSKVDTPHHQTVQVMIDWSYNLLSAEEQLLLKRMAIFRGDFSLEAAEGVLGEDAGPGSEKLEPDDVLILMLQLVNKSLVVAMLSETHTETRYRLLEMVRQYSQEKLETSGATAYLSYKHLAFYTDFVEKGFPQYRSSQSAKWLDLLEQENTNLRTALTWAMASSQHPTQGAPVQFAVPQGELALRLISNLGRFWYLKSYINEGRRWLEDILALQGLADRADLKTYFVEVYKNLADIAVDQTDQAIRYLELSLALSEELGSKSGMAAALGSLGTAHYVIGDYAQAKLNWFRSLTLMREIEDTAYIPYMLHNLGLIAMNQGNIDEALGYFNESEAKSRLQNDNFILSYILRNLGMISFQKQDIPEALSKVEESVKILRRIGNKQSLADTLNDLSVIHRTLQNYREARLIAEEAVAICEEIGDTYVLSTAYCSLTEVYIKEGKVQEARRYGMQNLEIQQKSGNNKKIMYSLVPLAKASAALDRWEEYIWLYTAADTLRQQLGVPWDYIYEQDELDRLNEQSVLHLDRPTLDRLRVKGQTDSLEDIIKQVLATK